MNLQSGKFTVPRTGKYHFSASGRTYYGRNSGRYFVIGLYKNSAVIGSSHGDEISDTDYLYEIFSLQSTLNLVAGDQIWLESSYMPSGVYLAGYTHFTGWLLEEDISKTLNIV
jgi:hypothetical protein